jgi:hypothetical protein
MVNSLSVRLQQIFPILALLHPRTMGLPLLVAAACGVVIGTLGILLFNWQLWMAAAFFLAILFVPGVFKWRLDWNRYGWVAAGLSFLLVTQGFHTVEHIAQWTQYHILNWSMAASSGILSPANSEWVHFTWNWIVLTILIVLIFGGLRNVWVWILLAWAAAHTFEHSYTFIRYLMVLDQLKQLGFTDVSAQGLPGILGDGGWLAQSAVTRGTFFCRIPGLTTANRIDVHFVWNLGEVTFLILAAHLYLRQHIHLFRRAQAERHSSTNR